jgi:CubicO group peptidase (beta-lactamase class C family)/pimeloyl-ACP methyl ester carboxylesterase
MGPQSVSLFLRRPFPVVLTVFAVGLASAARLDGQELARLTGEKEHAQAFDREVGALARRLNLPGLVVVVARDGKIVHKVELGYADVDAKTPATADRIFWLASVTKPFVATLIMQRVEQGTVRLDDRMIDHWFPSFFPIRMTAEYRLRHVLGHTAQGTPGRTFVYNGGRFGFVYGVFEKAGGQPLKEQLIQRILKPLKLGSTLPGIGDGRYKELRPRLVTPYRYDSAQHKNQAARDVLRMGDLFASSGMASSATDLVRFAHALDTDELLSAESHAVMTRPAISTDGHALPYGVGWFSQDHGGERLVWHYGYGNADSALLLRVPRQKLTLVALANSDRLSACTALGEGDVLTSPLAVSFARHFLAPDKGTYPALDFELSWDRLEPRLKEAFAAAPVVLADEVFAQAVVRDAADRQDGRDDPKAVQLLKWLLRKSPTRLGRADTATLALLSRQSDPDLLAAAKPVLAALLASQPENPAVLEAAVRCYDRLGQGGTALDARRQLADLKGYEDDPRKQEAALWLGKHLSSSDPEQAAGYLWKARTWWFNSGNGGDLGKEIARAIDDMRVTRRGPLAKPRFGDNPAAGRTVDVGGAKIYYEVYGSGPPLLLLHGGLYGYIDEFAGFIPRLSQRYKVIAVATRGHGKSSVGTKEYSYRLFAEDAAAVLRKEADAPAVVVGFSDGARTAYHLAAGHPDAVGRVVALGAGHAVSAKAREWAEQLSPDLFARENRAFVERWKKLMPEPERWDEVVKNLRAAYLAAPQLDERELKGIRCPVLIVGGDRDRYNAVADLARTKELIPKALLSVIPSCDHVGVITMPHVLADVVWPFLLSPEKGEPSNR